MKTKRKYKDRKGISPVIAAIILVAVTVALAIGVAVWMGALTFTFMQTEQLLITDAEYNATYFVIIDGKNTGTTSVTISEVTLKPYAGTFDTGGTTTFPLTVGGGSTFTIYLNCTTTQLTVGNNYEAQLLTARGNRFTYTFTA